MEKNVAGKWVVFAYGSPDHATLPGEPITGDAANITANIRIDGGAANPVDDTNPTELEDGYYIFDITAVESNGDLLSLHPASATANVLVIGVPGALYTRPANFNDLSIAVTTGRTESVLAAVTHTGAVIPTVSTVTDGAKSATALSTATWTATKAGYLDAAITTRLAPTTAGRTLDVNLTGEAGIDLDNTSGTLAKGTDITGFNDVAATDIVSSGAITTSGGAVVTTNNLTTNNDKTGYSLTQAFPTNFADLAITLTTGQVTVGTNNDKTGYTASTVTDKTGYSISGTKTTLDALNDVAATDIVSAGAITTSGGAVSTVTSVANTVTANMTQINSNAAAAVRLALSAGQIIPFTVTNSPFTPTASEFEASDVTEATADHYKSRIILWTTGSLAGQITSISVYALAGSNGHFTVVAMTEAPGNGDTGIIL